jgi:cyanophycin synthetase
MINKHIEILDVIPLRGPNIWTYRPALEARVDIGELEDFPSNTIPGLYERLSAWLPSLIEHKCGIGEHGGFLKRVREGTWAGHMLEHIALELQNLAGMQSGFGKARETSQRGIYKVVIRARQEEVSRACLFAARDLLVAAIRDQSFDVAGTVERLRDMADSLCLGPSTKCIVDAATDRHIPSIRLTDGNLVQLGYGIRSRRIWTAETELTSAIGEGIASDKDLTKELLQNCGVPVPEGQVVNSPADAWAAAEDIGLPVVVKPTDGNHGRGVSMELYTREEIEAAFHIADAEGSEVIVERYVRGNEHRLLVVGGKLVAAIAGEKVTVIGDGSSNIRQLIDSQLHTDPRRGAAEEFPLDIIDLDNAPSIRLEIERQGFSPESVPPAGTVVTIQRNGNVAFDVTDKVHPSTAATAALAARIVGLDIAGIDLVVEDISRPLADQRGAIVEVNAGPSLLMHLKPASGQPRPVGEAIVASLFPAEQSGRIPIVGIAGSDGMDVVARLTSWLLQLSGKHVGMASRDGLYFDRRHLQKGNCANWQAGHQVLLNRAVEAAVFENGSGMILGEGLAYDRCQVGVVTNIRNADGLAAYDITDLDQVYNVLRTQVDVVLPDGVAVLNADDERVAKMAPLCDGSVIFFAREASCPALAAHRAEGGRALFIADGQIILASGQTQIALLPLSAVPCLNNGTLIDDVLAAIGAAWALGIDDDLIRTGVETFEVTRTH